MSPLMFFCFSGFWGCGCVSAAFYSAVPLLCFWCICVSGVLPPLCYLVCVWLWYSAAVVLFLLLLYGLCLSTPCTLLFIYNIIHLLFKKKSSILNLFNISATAIGRGLETLDVRIESRTRLTGGGKKNFSISLYILWVENVLDPTNMLNKFIFLVQYITDKFWASKSIFVRCYYIYL
jgi:hypothetical protein